MKSYAAAHLYTRPDGKKPLFIGEIILESGPALLANLDADSEESLANCKKVTVCLISIEKNDNGEELVDLFFEPAGGE